MVLRVGCVHAVLGRIRRAAVDLPPVLEQRFQLHARRRERDAGLEASHEVEIVPAAVRVDAVRVERERQPHAHALIVDVESLGHDADDLRLDAIDVDLLADDRALAAEVAAPQLIGKERDRRRVRERLLIGEPAAGLRCHA
jgi:hypothetical protein